MYKRLPRQLGFWVGAISVLAIAWCAPFRAHAQTLWYVDDDAPLDGNGLSWGTAFRYLQDALEGEGAIADDVIQVAAGTYKPDQDEDDPNTATPGDREATFQLINGVAIYGGYAGYGAPDPNEHDIWLYESILSGDLLGNDDECPPEPNAPAPRSDNSYHVVSADDSITDTANTILDGFTIAAGNADWVPQFNKCDGPDDGSGAGLYNVEGSPTVSNCRFVRNYAACWGGGMANFDDDPNNGWSQPYVFNCVFEENWGGWYHTNTEASGGGMYNGDGDPALQMPNSGSDPTVVNCLFIGNRAGHGFPTRDYHDGGGMCNDNSHPTVVNCIFIANGVSGGTLLGGYGGGLASRWGSSHTITNCTFSGNEASPKGGAVCVKGEETSVVLTNSILWGDSAEQEGSEIAVLEGATLTVSYSDVQGDPNDPNDIYVDDPNSSTLNWGDGNIGDDPNFHDPKFLDPKCRDYYLQPGSPCIDAGDNTAVPEGIGTDFDGSPRFIDDPNTEDSGNQDPNDPNLPIVDMGAYEYDPNAPRIDLRPSAFTFVACEGGPNPRSQSLYIRNKAARTLNWTIDKRCDWLHADPNSAQTVGADEVALSVDATGLARGRYECRFKVVDERASNSPGVARVTLYVGQGWYVDASAPDGGNGSLEKPFNKIQNGIDAATDFDTVLVLDGTYTGNGNWDMDFGGNAITVRCLEYDPNEPNKCTIDCWHQTESHRAFWFHSGETPLATVEGFKITNGYAGEASSYGGGIFCQPSINQVSSGPTIRNCVFSNNVADERGGAICFYLAEGGSATVLNCTFSGNQTNSGNLWMGGGGVYCDCGPSDSAAIGVTNCTFDGNLSGMYGGGLYVRYAVATVTNCEFLYNEADRDHEGVGGGVYVADSSDTSITNCSFTENVARDDDDYRGAAIFCWECELPVTIASCIAWGNRPQSQQIHYGGDQDPPPPDVRYCDVEGGWPGDGNISSNPLFCGSTDLRLQVDSPCIDAGDNTAVPCCIGSDLDGNPRFIDDRHTDDTGYGTSPMVDMGAYELVRCPGDVDGDGDTDLTDLAALLSAYGSFEGDPNYNPAADFDDDGDVDLSDLAFLLTDYGCTLDGGGGDGGESAEGGAGIDGATFMDVFIEPYDTGGYQGGGFHGEVDHFVFDMKIEVFDLNDDWTVSGALIDAYNSATFRLSSAPLEPDAYATFVAAPWVEVPSSPNGASVVGAYLPADPTYEFEVTGINIAWFNTQDSHNGPATVLRSVIDVSAVPGADVSGGFGSVYFSRSGPAEPGDILVADLLSESGSRYCGTALVPLSGEFYVKGE